MVERKVKVRFDVDTEELSRAVTKVNAAFSKFALAASAAAGAASGAMIALTAKSLGAVDAQAKLAQSLGTTTVSMQNLSRAGELAGVNLEQIAQVGKDLTRRLSQAAAGMGEARDALKLLNLQASDLMDMPLDKRISTVTEALNKFVPEANRAAIAGKLFGEEGSIAALRLKPEVIAQATAQVAAFGVAVSDVDAAAIEAANDALSQIGLVVTGLGNRLASTLAPALQEAADRFTDLAREGGPVAEAMDTLTASVGQLADTLTSEAFVSTAAATFTSLIDLANGTAQAFVWLTSNTETLTYALSALAIGVAAAGGPITWVIGLTGAAVAGFAAMNRSGKEAARSLDDIADSAMGVKRQGDSAAGGVANVNSKLSTLTGGKSAVVAANASIAGSFTGVGNEADTAATKIQKTIDKWREAGLMGIPGFGAPGAGAADIEAFLNKTGTGSAPGGIPTPRGMTEGTPLYEQGMYGSTLGLDFSLPKASGGGGGGGGGASGLGGETLDARLEALQTELATEQEIVDEWYEKSKETLVDALEQKKLTRQEYNEAIERLEKEHQERMIGIARTGSEGQAEVILGALETSLAAVGQFNDKAFEAAKIAGAAQAFISTLVGQAKALELPFPANLAAAAKVFASGMSVVAAIKNFSGGGASAGKAAVGGGGASASGPAAQAGVANLTFVGTQSAGDMLNVVEQINKLSKEGYKINARAIAS